MKWGVLNTRTVGRAGLLVLFVCTGRIPVTAQSQPGVKLVNVDSGWAANSVNTVVFRKSSLVSFKDTQFISFYNKDRYLVIGKRKQGSGSWQLKQTQYQGNTADAHNAISMMVDGDGYLHLAWDHHNNPLRYCRSKAPGSLELAEKAPMTGKAEGKVSYPEFHKLPGGDLLFFYRDGGSGNGNLVINKYSLDTKSWTQLQQNLLDGEGARNAYWQACVDAKGIVHISWVWRESPDVASNHDMAYACSKDGGITWQKSNGEKYVLPITAATAEYALRIPQRSELMNQTSMTADEEGRPFIASYWRDRGDSVPQYHLMYQSDDGWKTVPLAFRKTPFSLSGQGSKRVPIARPQILVKGAGENAALLLLFRDEERGGKASALTIARLKKPVWKIIDLTDDPVGSWEPTYDTELWKERKVLNLFVQKVEQVDAEGLSASPPQMVTVLEWKPKF